MAEKKMVQQICIPLPKLDTGYSIFKLCAGQKSNQEMHPCLEPSLDSQLSVAQQTTDRWLTASVMVLKCDSPLKSTELPKGKKE